MDCVLTKARSTIFCDVIVEADISNWEILYFLICYIVFLFKHGKYWSLYTNKPMDKGFNTEFKQ